MRYYSVAIQHKQYMKEGSVNLKVLGNSYLEVSNSICTQLKDAGYNPEDYLVTIKELIGEEDLNKAANG